MSESLEKIKISDPQKYERIMYMRKTGLLLFFLALPVIYWLDLQIGKYIYPSNFRPALFVSYFMMFIMPLLFLIMKITYWLLRKKYGAAEVLRQEEEKKETQIRVDKEILSGKRARDREKYIYMPQLGITLFSLFTGIIASFLLLIHQVFGIISLGIIMISASSLGSIASAVVIYKKMKDKSGG